MPVFHAKKRRFLHDGCQKSSPGQTFVSEKDTIAPARVF
jgi:hypothetical protein